MPRKAFAVPAIVILTVLSAVAQRVVADIPLSASPFGVAVNPFHDRIYAALTDFSTGAAALAVIDGRTNSQVKTIPLPAAFLVGVDLGSGRVYVAGCNFLASVCVLSVLDGDTDKVLATIPISTAPAIGVQGLAVNPVTSRVYVSDADNLQIDVINGGNNTLETSISLGGQQPLGLAADFVGNRIVAVINGPLIAIIDGRDNKILERLLVGAENANVAVNPVTARAYVTNETFAPSTVGVVNLNRATVVTDVPVGNNPFGVAADLISNRVIVTNLNDQTISVIDGKTNQVVETLGVFGRFVDVNPIRGLAYASDDFSQSIHVISIKSN